MRPVTIILLILSLSLLAMGVAMSSIALTISSLLLIIASIIFERGKKRPRVIAMEDLESDIESLKRSNVPPDVRREVYELEEKIRRIRDLKEISWEAKQRLLDEYRRRLRELR